MKKTDQRRSREKTPGASPASEEPRRSGLEHLPGRRRFLNRIWLLLVAIGVVEVIVVLVQYFRPRKPQADLAHAETVLTAGKVSDFAPGSVTAYPQGRFYLVRLEDGGFLAVSRQCTHLGCTVPWDADQKRFACPCHASVFDMTGSVLQAPAPRPLDCFPVSIENNTIRVDTGRRMRRNQFNKDQVTYANADQT